MSESSPHLPYFQVQDKDQLESFLQLLEQALESCRNAVQNLNQNQKEEMSSCLSDAFDVVSGLRKGLNMDVDGAENFEATYEFICHQITLANVMKSQDNINNAVTVLERLRDVAQEALTEIG